MGDLPNSQCPGFFPRVETTNHNDVKMISTWLGWWLASWLGCNMLLGFSPKDKYIAVKLDKISRALNMVLQQHILTISSNYIIQLYIYICNMYLFPKLMINKPLKMVPYRTYRPTLCCSSPAGCGHSLGIQPKLEEAEPSWGGPRQWELQRPSRSGRRNFGSISTNVLFRPRLK